MTRSPAAAPLAIHVAEAFSGGVARQLLQAAHVLPARGWRVHFLLSRDRSDTDVHALARLQRMGAPVSFVHMTRRLSFLHDAWAGKMLIRRLAQLRPALVHLHAAKAGFLGRWAAWRAGIPAVYTPHVFPFEWAGGSSAALYAALERWAGRRSARILCLTEAQRNAALAAGLGSDRLRVLSNGVDTDMFRPPVPAERAEARARLGLPRDAVVLGMTGRWAEQKDWRTGWRAAARVRARWFSRKQDGPAPPPLRIAVAGDAGARLQRLAAEAGLAHETRWLGGQDDMRPFFHAVDLLVVSSRWEGLPYAVLEAQAAGVAVAATANRGTEALVEHEVTGLLSPVGDGEALGENALRLLADDALRSFCRTRARARAEASFSLERWADGVAETYREIAAP